MENMLCFTVSPLAVGKKNLGHWDEFFQQETGDVDVSSLVMKCV